MWGLDRDTFADVARIRDDASPKTLAELVALVAPDPSNELPPAIAVDMDAVIGDVISIQVVGTEVPVEVRVVAVADFFPGQASGCLLYTSPSPRDRTRSRMPSSA